jgi:flagellum-specific peptidoglycan hydrolase FlgJ
LFAVSFVVGRFTRFQALEQYEKELLILDLQQEKNKFTQEKFVEELKRLNVKFPYIVMAQSILETGHWKSKVFKENHNLFGMKQANIRINTAKGTNLNHAYYENWQESVYDYAFYQCRYMGAADTEEEYFLALGASYAEAGNYVQALKTVIAKEHLKDLF